jgi:hypothetical protein
MNALKYRGFRRALIIIQLVSFFIMTDISANPLAEGADMDKGGAGSEAGNLLNFYVAMNGSDRNPGSEAKPWRTIQKAAHASVPGSTVYVKEGVYKEKIVISVSGNEKAGYITFQPYPGHRVVIDGSNRRKRADTFGDCIFYLKKRSYICIKGFEIAHTNVNDGSAIRIYDSADHIQILDNKIYDIRGKSAMGITVYGKDGPGISDLLIKGNEIYDCQPAPSEALSLNGNVRNFEITDNVIHDLNNIGIDMIGGEKWLSKEVARDGICRGNTIYNVHSSSGDGYAAGIYVDGGKNIIIERNRIYACDLGLEVGAENSGVITEKIIVRNNLVHNNDKAGIAVGAFEKNLGMVLNCIIINNTIYKNNRVEAQGELWIQYAGRLAVVNNIVYGVPNTQGEVVLLASANPFEGTYNRLDYNLYYVEGKGKYKDLFLIGRDTFSSLDGYKKALKQDGHSRFLNPLFSELPDKGKGGFTLAEASPAGDAGNKYDFQGENDYYGNPRLKGAQVDIGAVEQ